MDLPVFMSDFFGNRVLIGVIAGVHVWINHAFAVGMIPLLVLVEWWAHRLNRPDWDTLAYKILGVCFIVTTSLGALTGVGIWLSVALVNPYAIGSLLRVFYWVWFTEWIVFVTEVCLILAYFLTWKRMTGERKPAHIRIGIVLTVMSWLTMAVIVGILGFMMNPGDWLADASLLSGFLNPIYLPQLLFRTPIAMAMAGSLALALSMAFTARGSELRGQAVRGFSGWTLFWLVPTFVGAIAYYHAIPEGMLGNMPVALGTQAWESRYDMLVQWTFLGVLIVVAVSLWGLWRPGRAHSVVWVVPIVILFGLISYFERAREFIRKPYVVGYYMYSSGIRVADVPYLMKSGVLANSLWARNREVTEANKIDAGREVYTALCSRCHTLNGINPISGNFRALYPGQEEWDPGAIEAFLKNMHGARPFMPPFVGTAAERSALAAYLATLDTERDIPPPPLASESTRGK